MTMRRRSVVLAAIVVAAAACSTGPSVTAASTTTAGSTTGAGSSTTTTVGATTTATSPTTTTTTAVAPTTFAAIGDYGDGGLEEAATSAMIGDWAPDFIVTAGDNTYGSAGYDTLVGRYYADYIGDYYGDYGPGAPINRFFPALGNHDYTDASLEQYLDFFTLPGQGYTSSSGNERYYDVVLGPVHWFFVNSDSAEPDGIGVNSVQAAWLHGALTSSDSTWNVVVFHHAAYGSTHHKGEEALRWPFAEWGADLVLSGHNHNYERFAVDGVTYATVGLGRTNVPLGDNPLDPHSVFFFGESGTGALHLTACENALVGEFATVGSGVIDSFVVGSGTCG